jgi:hypothetical protein
VPTEFRSFWTLYRTIRSVAVVNPAEIARRERRNFVRNRIGPMRIPAFADSSAEGIPYRERTDDPPESTVAPLDSVPGLTAERCVESYIAVEYGEVRPRTSPGIAGFAPPKSPSKLI